MEYSAREEDWSAARRRSATRRSTTENNRRSSSQFWIAVAIFFTVALAYPWYSYRVNAFLLTRDLEAAGREFARISDENLREVQKQAAQSSEASKREQQRRRIASVKIMGVSDGPNGQVVIVDMGSASLDEAQLTICRQASTWLKSDVIGTMLTVQRYRMNQPVLDLGVVRCR